LSGVNLSGILLGYTHIMTSCVFSVASAYATFGLLPEAGLDVAKKAFRDLVKTLHPDITPATPATLSRLAHIVAAMRYLETMIPACMEVEISESQAKSGTTRSLRTGDKSVLVRIPANTEDGSNIQAVGETDIVVLVKVLKSKTPADEPPDAFDFGPLDDFIDEFSRPSANTRYARWIRKAQSAA
jgi:hypothetical protein